MSEQKEHLTVEKLVAKLSEYFNRDFTVSNIHTMRRNGTIPAVDDRTPGTKTPRWKYDYEEVLEALKKL